MEDEGEIEYLDEDEELVQQCVQVAPSTNQYPIISSVSTLESGDVEEHNDVLLVERKKKPRDLKRRPSKTEEDDSDYDPSEDLQDDDDDLIIRKRKKNPPKKITRKTESFIKIKSENKASPQSAKTLSTYEDKLRTLPNLTVQKKAIPFKPQIKTYPAKKFVKKEESINDRRKLDIRIPDYADPLCLPVRAIKKDGDDLKKLKIWNNLCLEHYRKLNSQQRPGQGQIVSSTRTIMLKNVKNKFTDRLETSIYGKFSVEDNLGLKKSETYQGVLPRYREKKILPSYPLVVGLQRHFKHTYEAVLTKENEKDGDVLVVYKPKEAISAVYKFVDKINTEKEDSTQDRKSLKEMTCCKVCAPCYQASWRGTRKQSQIESLPCAICSRTFVSVYNLLTHLNTNHSAADVAKHREQLSKTLATVVDYHYRCRICQEPFNSIKLLRKHVPKHQGTEVFTCEIGNHMAS